MSSRSRSTSSAIRSTPSGDDGECLQSAARKPRLGAYIGAGLRRPAEDRAELSLDADRDVAVRSIRLTRRIAAQPAFARYHPEEYRPGSALESDAELEKAAGDIGTTIFHPVGTCRMGADPDSVVDPRLRLRALKGLRIADASVMPTITSGNTNSPTLMIAEKAAAMILEDHR